MESTNEGIAITGIGLVSPLGIDAESTWKRVKNNECGIRAMSVMESPLPPGKDGGQAVDLPNEFSPELPREARYLKWAISQALQSAGVLHALPCSPARACYMMGTTLHGMRAAGRFLRSGDYSHLRSFSAGDVLRLATEDFPIRGGSATTCSACSSSLGSIALATTLLQSGEADLVVAGGYDAISEYAWAGFNSLRLVSELPLRPFARNRQGMKLAEAYAVVVLERNTSCQQRNHKSFAFIAGWGESADAHHLTQPHPQGTGAFSAMQLAIHRSGIEPEALGLIAAHATGTPDNDASERAAIVQILSNQAVKVPVVGFKSHFGHTLGGAGACELIMSMMALNDQVVPATANIDSNAIEFDDLPLTHTQSKPLKIDYTLNTSLGFGGANTCLVLSRKSNNFNGKKPIAHQVAITGFGAVLPGVSDVHGLCERLRNDQDLPSSRMQAIDEDMIESMLNARRTRRMSNYVKLTLAASAIAIANAKWHSPVDAAAILGTTHGSAGYCYDYYRQIVEEGVLAANPMLFAEGVPNAAAAQLSLMLGLKQACQTLIGTRTAGLDAIRFASARIRQGLWTRAIVSAGEELSPIVIEAYRSCGLHAAAGSDCGFECGSGAVAITLESIDAAKERGSHIYGTICHASSSSGPNTELVKSIGQTLEHCHTVIGSGNHTFIDNAEQIAARQNNVKLVTNPVYNRFGELFSATPLLALISGLIHSKEEQFGILCTDFGGIATTLNVQVNR